MAALEYLCDETETEESDWREVSGPETGVGVEHWFEFIQNGSLAYVVDDQGEFTISLPSE